ncbi:hypothetical protein [Streptomyces sp. NPDC029004]|uniref:hypothetical protein n=1 Tax=Streptomyces sp. NPDC029004 TaxID=3154490 RepID=UPI0033DD549E
MADRSPLHRPNQTDHHAMQVDAAARFLAEHQGVFDEAEDAQQSSAGVRAA